MPRNLPRKGTEGADDAGTEDRRPTARGGPGRGDGPDGEEVLLALGSNLGDRLEHLRGAVRGLRERSFDVLRVSSVVESPPLGVAAEIPQGDYWNAAVRARTVLAPRAVLDACRSLEEAAGRTRPRRGAPRTLDVDIIFHGQRRIRSERLVVPHPRWKERGFVLWPLLEIAPAWTDPESGDTVEAIGGERLHLLDTVRVVAPPAALARS